MSETTYTPSEAQSLGFSEDELQLLREAGLIETRLEEPWQPRTLDDVSWLVGRLRALRNEREIVAAQAQKRIERTEAAEASLLARFGEQMRAIVEEGLPRKRDGSYAKKSLDLLDGRVGIRVTKGRTAIVDEEALLDFAENIWRDHHESPAADAIREAFSVTVSFTGDEALDRAFNEGARPKIALTPLRKLIEEGTPDPATGEVKPLEVPGVEVQHAEERLYWE